MGDREVVIAGAGPTGLMLAGELALNGIDVVIVERRTNQEVDGSRAGGLHARTIEVFDQRGIADRFLAEGQPAQVAGFGGVKLDISDFPTRHPYGLGLWQRHVERILAGWVDELGVPILRRREVRGLGQDEDGVDVRLRDGETLRASYLVGCDGGRSAVRKAAGIAFPGSEPTISHLIAEVEVTEEPAWGVRRDARGTHGLSRVDYEIRDGQIVYADAGPVRVMVTEEGVGATAEPALADLSAALVEIYGTDFGIRDPIWISRFTDAARQAATYREGRVLLAGDAAHVHYPVGGQGLNIGVQDAVNLGWKLAQVVRGMATDALLDTYEAERHPVAAAVLRRALAQVVLNRPDHHSQALSQTVAELLEGDEARRLMAAQVSGLGIHYDLGGGHPLVGRRMPDLDLITPAGPMRTYQLLHRARPALIDLGIPGGLEVGPWADRVRLTNATTDGPWELPAIGPVTAPSAVLVRPDGYVAWVGEGSAEGLAAALATWFGAAD
jgi:2-polyprenyl-6-methoxyphenol hydroxylase-like FAD-dependent oxidoreductase